MNECTAGDVEILIKERGRLFSPFIKGSDDKHSV